MVDEFLMNIKHSQNLKTNLQLQSLNKKVIDRILCSYLNVYILHRQLYSPNNR